MSKVATDSADGEPVAGRLSDDARVDMFLRRHYAELLHFFQSRLAQPQDAADMAQEACARLLRYRRGQNEAALRLLLFRIARNLLNDHWRWNSLHAAEEYTDPAQMVFESGEPSQERRIDSRHRLERLEAVMLALPDKCRNVFVLSRIQGLSNLQVARRCNISVKMVEKHIARALAECRRQVGDPEP